MKRGRRHHQSTRRLATVAGAILYAAAGSLSSVEAQPHLPKDPADLSKPFSHDTHLAEKLKDGSRTLTCGDCHEISKAGGGEGEKAYPICETVRMPFPDHDACISCHPTAFFVKPLQICTNCHQSVAITEKIPLKEQNAAEAPLKTVFDHRLHLDPKMRVKKRFGFEKDCTHCHTFIRGGERVSLPQHAQCCECHTKENVEPNINDCATCHQRPPSQRNPRSMVRKFSHADHRQDPADGTSLPCLRCHFEVPKARKVARLKLPKMATCVECHQGELAFSYADCLRCHDEGIETRLVPESHQQLPKEKEGE